MPSLKPMLASSTLILGSEDDDVHPGGPDPSTVRPAPPRADQRLLLRPALAGAGDHLRPVEHQQLRPWGAVHDGRLRGLDAPELCRPRLLVGADPGAARGR